MLKSNALGKKNLPFFSAAAIFFSVSDYPRFPTVLRALLNKPGRSQRWLMKKCDFSAATVTRILFAVQEPSRAHLRAICLAFSDWHEIRMLLAAHLQDELDGAGFTDRQVLLLDEFEANQKELLPAFDGYLRVISHRLMVEQSRPQPERLFSAQVEWLSSMAVRVTALEADANAISEVPPAS